MAHARLTNREIVVPDEHALAFCFDVLSSVGSMAFTALCNLLRPWGWSRNGLLDRFNELQQSGLVLLEHPSDAARASNIRVYITSEGRRLSEGTGLPCRRAIPALSTEQASGKTKDAVSEQPARPGRQS